MNNSLEGDGWENVDVVLEEVMDSECRMTWMNGNTKHNMDQNRNNEEQKHIIKNI